MSQQPTTTPSPTLSSAFTTTFSTSHPPTSFTRPTTIPSLFPFGPALSCSLQAAPTSNPRGTDASCAISNRQEDNDHAFWDLLACCKDGRITANGAPRPCDVQCEAAGQSWRELGECLSGRVDVVVCKAGNGEGSGVNGTTSGSSSGSVSSAPSASVSGSGAAASSSTGAASVVGVVNVGGSKVAAVVFGMLAVVSFVGMML